MEFRKNKRSSINLKGGGTLAEEKKILLTPEVFKVNESGEVVINNAQLVEEISRAHDEIESGEQGISVTVTIGIQ